MLYVIDSVAEEVAFKATMFAASDYGVNVHCTAWNYKEGIFIVLNLNSNPAMVNSPFVVKIVPYILKLQICFDWTPS